MKMQAIHSSDARRDWSSVMDLAVHQKPVFIQRTRDKMMLSSVDLIARLVANVRFEAVCHAEPDGSVTLALRDLDLAVNAPDLKAAKAALARDLADYAEEYYQEFERYSNAPNRRDHMPYVFKVLTAKDLAEVEAAIVCPDGES